MFRPHHDTNSGTPVVSSFLSVMISMLSTCSMMRRQNVRYFSILRGIGGYSTRVLKMDALWSSSASLLLSLASVFRRCRKSFLKLAVIDSTSCNSTLLQMHAPRINYSTYLNSGRGVCGVFSVNFVFVLGNGAACSQTSDEESLVVRNRHRCNRRRKTLFQPISPLLGTTYEVLPNY